MNMKFVFIRLLTILAAGFAGSLCTATAASPQKTVVFYDPLSKTANLADALKKEGWTPVVDSAPRGENLGKLLKDRPKALCIWSPESNDIPADEWTREIAAYVRRGGTVFISSHGELNLSTYFPDEDCAVRWSGWDVDEERKSTFVKEGDWLRLPNSMGKIFSNGISPSSGYDPLSDGWTVFAKMRMANGEEFPYLLSKTYGKGVIVLTSSDLGMSGGYEMFGSDNIPQAALLINQLLHQ